MIKTNLSVEKSPVALFGGRLIDGTGADPVEDSAIVSDGTIVELVGKSADIRLPRQCRILDVSGMTVIPGMIDLHVHLTSAGEPSASGAGLLPPGLSRTAAQNGIRAFAHARKSLAMGFTTLRDVGDSGAGHGVISLRNAIAAGIVEGPRIVSCAYPITASAGHFDLMPTWLHRTDEESCVANGVDEILRAVRQRVKLGVEWVKFGATGGVMEPHMEQEYSDPEMIALVDEAHRKHRLVAAHALRARGILAAVRAGVDSVEHGSSLTEEIVDLMRARGTYLVPTLLVIHALLQEGTRSGLPEAYIEVARSFSEIHFASFRMALESGVKIAMGTDAGFGAARHGQNGVELELMVKHGMTPMQSLMASTKWAAEALHLGDKLGTIEKGKWADLVVVDGNPLEDISIIQDQQKIALVMKEGSLYVNNLSGG